MLEAVALSMKILFYSILYHSFRRLQMSDVGSLFLSDGGHVENLGALQLLRQRRKKIIVVCSRLHFSSFESDWERSKSCPVL